MAGVCPATLVAPCLLSFSSTCCRTALQTPIHPSKPSMEVPLLGESSLPPGQQLGPGCAGPRILGSLGRGVWVLSGAARPGGRQQGVLVRSHCSLKERRQLLLGKPAAALITQPSKCSGLLPNWCFISNYCLYSKHKHTRRESIHHVTPREARGGRQSAPVGVLGGCPRVLAASLGRKPLPKRTGVQFLQFLPPKDTHSCSKPTPGPGPC